MIRSAVLARGIKLNGECDVEGAVCSLPVCQMFIVSAVVEVVNLSLHWIAIPVDVNEGNSGGEVDIICVVGDIRSRIGI